MKRSEYQLDLTRQRKNYWANCVLRHEIEERSNEEEHDSAQHLKTAKNSGAVYSTVCNTVVPQLNRSIAASP